jgi:ribosomal protein L3 glutamine methyltransferase
MPPERTAHDWVLEVERRFRQSGLHFGHGTDNALDEAAWLVLHAIDKPLDGTFTDWRMPVDEAAAGRIERVARTRCETRQPLAYLLGEAWFAGLPFFVDERVLVPRSPIAELIDEGFRPWIADLTGRKVLDLCCGGGCIGIAIAVRHGVSQVDLADISPAAIELAGENVERHQVRNRTALHQSDLFAALADRRWDLIVSNPPYVPADTVEALPREYRAEPRLGLESGRDGLDIPLSILLDAPRHLCEDGVLVCEVGESQERLADLLPRVPFTWLEFARGGSGVFVLDRGQLLEAAPAVKNAIGSRNHVT